ncbi:FAD-dependent monooxygenase [Georgenia sp. AZ-5]|uniref:FAD-dependent monooxygenase n=1 Tax=Georgenia sp. AZ-5 TaxID=3367526 RepID=UPI0037550233
MDAAAAHPDVDVLVVGAGPTGLTLAAELERHGARLRVVDRLDDRVHESRALAVQPRTLEVLAPHGIGDELVRRGNPAVRLQVHAGAAAGSWPQEEVERLAADLRRLTVHRLSSRPGSGALHDPAGTALRRLGARSPGTVLHLLVRPDGHVA